jgi:hypothetical protein
MPLLVILLSSLGLLIAACTSIRLRHRAMAARASRAMTASEEKTWVIYSLPGGQSSRRTAPLGFALTQNRPSLQIVPEPGVLIPFPEERATQDDSRIPYSPPSWNVIAFPTPRPTRVERMR